MRLDRDRIVFLAFLLVAPGLAVAYGTRVHALLPLHALGSLPTPAGREVARDTAPGITDADLAAFREWLYGRAAAVSDTAARHAFLARYPEASRFDARALKEFLMMDGTARVLGVDSFAAVYRALAPADRRADPNPDYIAGRRIPLLFALELGSMYADLDRRNQNRLFRDASGAPVRTRDGDSIPFDPMTLNMGRLTGLSSQSHAHYALNRHPKSTDPATLKTTPWDFALPIGFEGPVETWADDNAQLYTDLAILAGLSGKPEGRALSALYAGMATHYMADGGNAIHTLQVGIYPIFVDATIQYWLRRAAHLFGLLGRTPSRNAIGIDIIGNLHLLSERLFEAELVEALTQDSSSALLRPSMRLALHALERGDDSLARALHDTLAALRQGPGPPPFGRLIVDVLAEIGGRDGATVYRLTRDLAADRLRTGRVVVDFDTVPDDQLWRWIRVPRAAPARTALDDFNEVESRGLGRSTTALRVWWAEYQRAFAVRRERRAVLMDAVLTRFITERLRYLEAAEARRQRWIAAHGGRAR